MKKRGYDILWLGIVFIVLLLLYMASRPASGDSTPSVRMPAESALTKLIEGNDRYLHQRLIHPDQSITRVREVSKVQHPFAAILGCSDSRVPPEIIYDQGIGDLFVVREAGNIVDDAVLASLEYAVEHLGVSLIVVLGHARCGAVEAALHDSYHGHLGTLVDAISPAAERVNVKSENRLDLVIRANVEMITERLKHSKPVLDLQIKSGKLKVVGGYYNLDTGKVEIISK